MSKKEKREEGKNIYETLYRSKKGIGKYIEPSESWKVVRCYFDLMAKVYTLLGPEARKLFPKLGETAAKTQLVLFSLQAVLRTQDKASKKILKRALKEEAQFIKDHEGTPIAELFNHIKPQFEELLET
jgi:hypothetical protein